MDNTHVTCNTKYTCTNTKMGERFRDWGSEALDLRLAYAGQAQITTWS